MAHRFMKYKPSSRRGYALATVVIFVTVLSASYAVAFHQVAGSLRLQRLRGLQELRDTGSMQALAQSLSLLETGFPPTSVVTGKISVNTAGGAKFYTVTIRHGAGDRYTVTVSPTPTGQSVAALPSIFTLTTHPN